MKLNKHPFLDFSVRVIAVFLILFVSIELDKLSFGMMNATNTISFGLGVALLCGSNLICGYLIYDIAKSIKSIYKKN